MKILTLSALHSVSAGCGELTAREAYIAYLKICTQDDRQNIANIHKKVFMSLADQGAVDEETIRQALVTAFENASF